uniref:EGF-like domain-containing protein n=1 Tax=Trichuris muris TaxID=70415 RepID=A0A5S6R199_TRIMR
MQNGLLVVHTVLPFLLSFVSGEDKIPDRCDVCRTVASGFLKGLKKTEASHFAGGNTDWEDRHLGKYAESETRFIEIVEMVCGQEEHDHPAKNLKKLEAKCHLMIEQQEELLEKWFYGHRASFPDLFKWLCIDQMKVCCPRNHFGPQCASCPGDPNRPCFGNGACHGSGTRFGTGKCVCNIGYQGKLCRKCAHNYYAVHENETHVSCTSCHEACKGGCHKGGLDGCKDCRPGWRMVQSKGCEDIDECESSPCSASLFERCENTPGSYKCECMEAFRREDGVCIPDPDATPSPKPVLFGMRAQDVLRCAAYSGLVLSFLLILLRPYPSLIVLFLFTLFVVYLIEKGALVCVVIMNDPRYAQNRVSVGATRNNVDQLSSNVDEL